MQFVRKNGMYKPSMTSCKVSFSENILTEVRAEEKFKGELRDFLFDDCGFDEEAVAKVLSSQESIKDFLNSCKKI